MEKRPACREVGHILIRNRSDNDRMGKEAKEQKLWFMESGCTSNFFTATTTEAQNVVSVCLCRGESRERAKLKRKVGKYVGFYTYDIWLRLAR